MSNALEAQEAPLAIQEAMLSFRSSINDAAAAFAKKCDEANIKPEIFASALCTQIMFVAWQACEDLDSPESFAGHMQDVARMVTAIAQEPAGAVQ